MSEEKYKIMDADVEMRFNSFESIPMGVKLDGEKFGFPGVKIMVTSCNAEVISYDGTMIYNYVAKVMK